MIKLYVLLFVITIFGTMYVVNEAFKPIVEQQQKENKKLEELLKQY